MTDTAVKPACLCLLEESRGSLEGVIRILIEINLEIVQIYIPFISYIKIKNLLLKR